MSSVCIAKCMNDARVPVRATYVNVYKWPESDAEFVRSVSSSRRSSCSAVRFGHPRVVESISCRQMYLRSYKFSREDTSPSTSVSHKSCFFGIISSMHNKTSTTDDHRSQYGSANYKKKKKCLFLGKVRDVSRTAFFGIFRRCLSCTATVDVVDPPEY